MRVRAWYLVAFVAPVFGWRGDVGVMGNMVQPVCDVRCRLPGTSCAVGKKRG